MDWKIIETDHLAPEDVDRCGSKLLIGNGYIGYRGTLEEFNKEQKTATIVSGLYDKVGDQWREPINLPNGGFVRVFYNGESLHALTGKVLAHEQSVDIRHAMHERATTFETAEGTCFTVRVRRFTSLARIHLLCIEYIVSADRDCTVDIHTGVDDDVWDINGPHLEQMTIGEQDGVISVFAVTHEKAVPVAVSEAIQPSSSTFIQEEGKGLREICGVRVQKDVPFVLHKFVSHVTGMESNDPLKLSRDLCKQAVTLGFATLLAEHAALWDRRWDDCDVQIEGDDAAQEALRFSMYHLLAIVPTHTERASIPARGMSGQMYKGAIFWDTEIFMLPFFTYTFPALARNLLLYRYHTLDGARRKAREYGYRGAYYAWESHENGDDACTLFNIVDVFTNRPMRTYFRDKQVHISGDVVYAFWAYYVATGDVAIWLDGGAEVVFECARFFLTYAYFNLDKQRYEILDVTGPDEYHERVHNNAFTNRLVTHTLETCLQVVEILRAAAPEFLADLVEKLDFERDLALIREITPQVYQPDVVVPGELIPQFDGYFRLEDPALKDLLARKLHPNEYLGGGNGLATTTQILKQADVVLTLFLFGECYPLETKIANWKYYEPRTEHGSSLSACSYSLIAAQIGRVNWAYKYFMKTATIDLTGEGKQYVGTLYIGGTHPAGNGGAWMSAIFGLCGIYYTDEMLTINPHLPANWKKVTLPFTVRGKKVRLTLTHEAIIVKPVHPLETPLVISVGNGVYSLTSADELKISVA
ncbi:MAG: glycoside hydrolase family 65 protein [Anaerolineae bacterium]|nr:glycoside hydrolase family 65 protein [Anaerolineae bacterium]